MPFLKCPADLYTEKRLQISNFLTPPAVDKRDIVSAYQVIGFNEVQPNSLAKLTLDRLSWHMMHFMMHS
ncbi:hypothetical protein J6590_023272 [Homalodisca vitripennis]|nr:hypothetical protein J6590_023272 [Homalodisca vitripennis]